MHSGLSDELVVGGKDLECEADGVALRCVAGVQNPDIARTHVHTHTPTNTHKHTYSYHYA